MNNKEYWITEMDKCVADIEYYYKTYVAQYNFTDVDEQHIKNTGKIN